MNATTNPGTEYNANPDIVTFGLTLIAFYFMGNQNIPTGMFILLATWLQYMFRLTPIWSDLVYPWLAARYLVEDEPEVVNDEIVPPPPPANLPYSFRKTDEFRTQFAEKRINIRREPTPGADTDEWLNDILATK